MMTAKAFVSKCVDIAKNYKTLYVSGCFGAPLSGKNVERYCNNNSYNRAQARQSMIKAAANQDPPTYGFDCVCLIKGVLWGWHGDPSATYGGAQYGSNGVPDIGEDDMIRQCSGVTDNFSGIVPGAAVWMPGHIGVYIGNGLVAECSPKWANGVQITAVGNIGKKTGYNTRTWKKWGLLPYVTYEEEEIVTYEQWKEFMERYRQELGSKDPAPWAVPYIDKCIDAGIVASVNGTMERPGDLLTRQEGAKMAAQTLEAAKK